jgi:hypothetical protein
MGLPRSTFYDAPAVKADDKTVIPKLRPCSAGLLEAVRVIFA